MERRRGYYFGTVVNGAWWRRAYGDALFARGSGELWYDDEALFFRRYLTPTPLVIPFEQVTGLSIGRWHAGRWGLGRPVIKVHWRRGAQDLSSGFAVAGGADQTPLLRELAQRAGVPVPEGACVRLPQRHTDAGTHPRPGASSRA
ncbi:MAG TPA: hypothetical protein GX714_04865 [Chloroflexi bacterium]|nr:hypothetical protein [Chloroflexota bacterium]